MLLRRLLISAFTACLGTSAISQNIEPRPELQISEETTFFTEPVNEDGLIDYVAVLNHRYGGGVSSDENAFALISLILPPEQADGAAHRREYWKLVYEHLKIERDPLLPRFIDWEVFASSRGLDNAELEDAYFQGDTRPWSAEEFPDLSAWVDANATVMNMLVEALKREHYYAPAIVTHEDRSLAGVMLPHLTSCRRMSRMILIRCFRSIGAGDFSRAVDDLILLHQFGRAVSHEMSLLGKLVGFSIQHMSGVAVEYLATQGTICSRDAIRFVTTRAAIPAIESIAESYDYYQRSETLDLLQRSYAGQNPPWRIAFLFEAFEEEDFDRIDRECSSVVRHPAVDVNQLMLEINALFDEIITNTRIPDPAARHQAYRAYDQILDNLITDADIIKLIRSAENPEVRFDDGIDPERIQDLATHFYVSSLMLHVGGSMRYQDRSNARRLVESTAIALLGYRDQHGVLPESLAALVPEYFDAVPIDFATGEALIYRLHEDGSAVVYSIGDNFLDDGGIDDYAEGDIAIRIGPAPE